MPCHEPEMREDDKRCHETCELIRHYAEDNRLVDIDLPQWIVKKNDIYPQGHKLVEAAAMLCAFCRHWGEDWIYGDARDPWKRRLADWWEEHQRSEGHEPILNG